MATPRLEDRLADLRELLAMEKAGDKSLLYMADLKLSIRQIERQLGVKHYEMIE